MADSAFIRDDDQWDDGWSRAPHGLWTLDVPNGAKVLLGWLHSHSGAFLGGVTINQARRAVGSSSIQSWFDALEAAGFISIERKANGSAHRITLKMAPWRALIGARDRAEIGSVTAPKSDRTEEQGEDHLSSSLRSEEELNSQVATVASTPRAVVGAFWEWHKSDRGTEPSTDYLGLVSIARNLLKRGYGPDEIIDAMKATKVMTAKAVSDEAAKQKHAREQTASTQAIPASIVRAFAKCEPWFERRGLMRTSSEKADWMLLCATQIRLGYGPGETMMRLAVALRSGNNSPFALTDAQVDRFNGEPADYPDAMERAYTNRAWRAS